jgi:nucleoside 2-deoxyribosyltransferase
MFVYYGIKYREANENRDWIDKLDCELRKHGINLFCVERDIEKYRLESVPEKELMEETFSLIEKSDIVLMDVSEKGIGLGIECGYAYSLKKPIYVIARKGIKFSRTVKGIATKIVNFECVKDIVDMLIDLR